MFQGKLKGPLFSDTNSNAIRRQADLYQANSFFPHSNIPIDVHTILYLCHSASIFFLKPRLQDYLETQTDNTHLSGWLIIRYPQILQDCSGSELCGPPYTHLYNHTWFQVLTKGILSLVSIIMTLSKLWKRCVSQLTYEPYDINRFNKPITIKAVPGWKYFRGSNA